MRAPPPERSVQVGRCSHEVIAGIGQLLNAWIVATASRHRIMVHHTGDMGFELRYLVCETSSLKPLPSVTQRSLSTP